MEEPLARSVLVVHRFIGGEGNLEATLEEVTQLATGALGATSAGLTIRDELGRPTTVVFCGAVAPEIDQVQYDAGSGPCLDAAQTGHLNHVVDTAVDERWPAFAAGARQRGIRSSLSLPVVVAGAPIGALNVYDEEAGHFDEASAAIGEVFAGQCAIAAAYWAVADKAENLERAIQSRAVIEQAKGILMATTGCSDEDAFDLLREQSQRENRKLRAIAEEIAARQRRRPSQP